MNLPRPPWRPFATAACVVLFCGPWVEGAAGPTEQEVKVAFIYQFTRFVEWPEGVSGEAPFVVAILASDQFWELAERTLAGKKTSDLPLSLRRISDPSEASKARILVVDATVAKRLPEVLRAVEGTSVLTIGDFESFAERGGMIGFRTVDNRVRFDINVEQASRSRLRISSEVLKLARVVRTHEER